MNDQKLSFEESMKRLEQIVRIMEQGEASLDDSLKLFQEGTELVRNCTTLLDEAQLKVNLILADGQGSPVEEDFEHASEF